MELEVLDNLDELNGELPVFSTFWARFLALAADGFIVSCLLFPVSFFLQCLKQYNIVIEKEVSDGVFGVTLILQSWLYFAFMESGSRQATYGKRLLGLKVSNLSYQKISFWKASARFFLKFISAFLCIGFILAALTEKKQAFHDLITATLVIKS